VTHRTSAHVKRFMATLTNVYIIIDGERVPANCPDNVFFDKTRTAALLQAHDALHHWLGSVL